MRSPLVFAFVLSFATYSFGQMVVNPPSSGKFRLEIDTQPEPEWSKDSYRRKDSLERHIESDQLSSGGRRRERTAIALAKLEMFPPVSKSLFRKYNKDKAERYWTTSTGKKAKARLDYCDHFSETIVLAYKIKGNLKKREFGFEDLSETDILYSLGVTRRVLEKQATIARKRVSSRAKSQAKSQQRAALNLQGTQKWEQDRRRRLHEYY